MSILAIDRFEFFPWYLEEEDSDLPDYNKVSSLSVAENSFLAALNHFFLHEKNKQYKFIGILLNTEVSSFEIELKKYLQIHRNVFKEESGDSFLILHSYTKEKKNHRNEKIQKTYSYIKELNISRISLPAMLIFSCADFFNISENPNTRTQSLTIAIEKNSKEWNGSLHDYFTIFFRCLFDSIDAVESSTSIKKLESEFKRNFRKQLGYNPAKDVAAVANMPVIGHIIKLITLAF